MNKKIIEIFGPENTKFLIGLLKEELSKYYDADEVDTLIAEKLKDSAGMHFEKVTELPAAEEADPTVIYLVPASSETDNNKYDEYYWDATGEHYEYLGSSSIDLSGYVKSEDIEEITNEKIKELWDSVFSEGDDEPASPDSGETT